jgi:hypothetical protein
MMTTYAVEQYDPEQEEGLTFKSLILENPFIMRIFPKNKDLKPGLDLYNYTVVFQFCIVIYILLFFSHMTGENTELTETFQFKRFNTGMIFFMFIQIILILLDRYFYISNVFLQIENDESDSDEEKEENLKTILASENKHNFIKLIIFVVTAILVHIVVVWYFPLTGNYQLNEQLYCEANTPCNDLPSNYFLWIFYIFYMLYFSVTALQFRYGLPEIRKGHFMYEKFGFINSLIFDGFFNVPFLFEVKTYIDWTFTETSLKIWDWFTFETIYCEFYEAKAGVEKDKNHEMGDKKGWINKFLFGFLGL